MSGTSQSLTMGMDLGSSLFEWMNPAKALRIWRERASARAVSRECLQIFRDLQARAPQASGVQRYLEVVMQHGAMDEMSALDIIDGATESFATWPVERELCFRDVVYYVAAQRCMAEHPRAIGVLTSLAPVIEAEIPAGL